MLPLPPVCAVTELVINENAYLIQIGGHFSISIETS